MTLLPASTLIELRQASVAYGAVRAVRDATMRVRQGDFIAVVGANGSGKTSLLRLLHGVVAHTGSREMLRPAGVQAMVFQRPFLLRLSVWNNLRIALWLARPDTATALRDERALQCQPRRRGRGRLVAQPLQHLDDEGGGEPLVGAQFAPQQRIDLGVGAHAA